MTGGIKFSIAGFTLVKPFVYLDRGELVRDRLDINLECSGHVYHFLDFYFVIIT